MCRLEPAHPREYEDSLGIIDWPLNDDHFVKPSFHLVSHFYINISLVILAPISHLGNAAYLCPRSAIRTHF